MPEDLIGDLFDDDVGGIGEDDLLIGDDDLVDALVSGAGDMEIVGDEYDIGDDDDDIGDDYDIGDDDDDIGDDDDEVGRRRRRRRRRVRRARNPRRVAAKQIIRKLAARNAGAVVSRGLHTRRRFPLGFVPTDVAASTTESIPASPQNMFRAERLVIPSDIAFDIGISDIKVGNQSQFVQNTEVPGAIFSEVAINTAVHFDTAEVGNQISVGARNKTAAEVEFTAALIGTTAKR